MRISIGFLQGLTSQSMPKVALQNELYGNAVGKLKGKARIGIWSWENTLLEKSKTNSTIYVLRNLRNPTFAPERKTTTRN